MKPNTKAIFGALLIAVMATIPALGQQPGTGFPPFGSFQPGGFDSINRQNLNIHFAIPIVRSPGRGLDFNFSLAYDSLLWRKLGSYWYPTTGASGAVTLGWRANPRGYLTYKTQSVLC